MYLHKSVGKFLLGVVCVCCGFYSAYGTVAAGLVRITENSSGNFRLILQDGESARFLFNAEERGFYVNKPLHLCLYRKKMLRLRFYSPRPIRNVIVWGKWKGMEEQVKLAEFEVLPAFCEYFIPLLFTRSDVSYQTRSGKRIFVPEKRHAEDLETQIESDDPYYLKIVASKCKWHISFGAYQGKHWTPLLPAHAREAVAIALNLAYLFSSDEFARELFLREGEFYADNQRKQVDMEELYRQIFSLPALVYGHVTGVNGLGGGSVFGLAEWCYLEHYADDTGVTRTIFHEFAHCLGYNHTGNMTYENGLGKGWVALCSRLYTKMGVQGELPVYSRRFLSTRECHHLYGKDMQLATSEAVNRN